MAKSTVQTFRENITSKIPVILKFPPKPDEWVECPECGHEQRIIGRPCDTHCSECGKGFPEEEAP